jgi:hypothetical protein
MKSALRSSLVALAPVFTVAFVGLGGAFAFAGCSSTVDATSDGGVTCDSSKCAAGNTCLEVNGETKCRKTCSSNLDPSKSCPLGYACRTQNDPEALASPIALSSLGAQCSGGTNPGGVAGFATDACPAKVCAVDARSGVSAYCSAECEPGKCPVGYTCVATTVSGVKAVCLKSAAADGAFVPPPAPAATAFCSEVAPGLAKKAKGQWGSACNPAGGVNGNPDCDSAAGFTCLARSPSDGDAYCSRACGTTADCGAGLFCGDINETPSADAAKREGFGSVIRVCQKRAYGAPCFADIDCPSAHSCAADNNGRRFCTIACEKDANCAVDAFCAPVNGKNICFPNAGVILGDGKFCSPCRADSDCKAGGGVCASDVSYTTERFCTVPSPSLCKSNGDCPKAPEGVAGSGCATKESDEFPAGACLGTFKLGDNALPGCWTAPRK